MSHRYTLQIVVGFGDKEKRPKMISVSKNTKFSEAEMKKHAHQYAVDHQLNPDTVGVNQLEDGKEMKGDHNHYASSAKVNSKKTGDKKEIEIEIGKGAKVGTLNVKENFFANLEEGMNLEKLKGASARDVRNAFAANYVAALLFLKLQDLSGLKLINDHGHSNLTKFSSTMSDLNFWGRALFYSNDADVKSRMKEDEAKVLSKAAAKVSAARVQKIMKVPLTAPDAVNWNEALGAILLLQYTFTLQSSYFNGIIRTLHKWESVSASAKQKAINDALMFMMQSDSSSCLIPHLRKLSNLVSIAPINAVAQRIVSFAKLNETDAGGAVSTGAVASGSNAIVTPNSANSQTGHPDTSQNLNNDLGGLYRLKKMATNQLTKKGRFTIRNGKLIKKKVKEFAPKKFTAPEFLHPTKKKEDSQGEKDAV
jgi:hypothetical protein